MAELTVLMAGKMWDDTEVERELFANVTHPRPVKFIMGNLAPGEPISLIPDEITQVVDGLFIWRNQLRAADIARFPKLKVVVRCGVGYDVIDRVECEKRGIKVTNVPEPAIIDVADHTLALVLSLRRGILLHHDLQRRAFPWSFLDGPPPKLLETPLSGPLVQRPRGRTFGIVGLGRIGKAVGLRAQAFGYKVLFYDPLLPSGTDLSFSFTRTRSLPQLFSSSDIISLHCPLTPQTLNLVDHKALEDLRPGAILINTSRGPVVNLDAVHDSLKAGKLAAAALDVLPTEPPDASHPLIKAYRDREDWLVGRLVITPHVAFYSPEAREDMRVLAAQTMVDVLLDGLETNVIPPSAY
ncbi:hypothetical protein TREMEDRAFT_45943 [Tremella mesenterica DSM 1558]|uniref:uncharacterized protein n=1 Tax=Tremella mesenterica (strain ATCC 24925 / CBS 8224 / DSM 1558 / NBRC 9311 / NRRL Y-6157 / RJB 2259-6 / UBC 559-6) TaxID=578456 RepID=UPI00032C7BB0|nr:uncharacterized protein TREMEDRAFT_45943 [Tremella mesenterica DSM 1558]EIW65888.1 hypothetical protein TREMEDRAFT_45943 [Tremella mesenterica DSM 1558]